MLSGFVPQTNKKWILQGFVGLLFLLPLFNVQAEELILDETCVVSVLNRTVQASSSGSWQLDNVPTFAGQVRARATCIREGLTVSGQTDYFTIPINGMAEVGAFNIVENEVIPERLEFTSGNNVVLYGNQTYFRLRVLAHYADGKREDVTRRTSGINYSVSNPQTAAIDDNGVLQGLNSGRILITARKDGVSEVVSITVVTTGDTDEDGLPDDYERANGLDPNDPVDAFEDADGDKVSALDEFKAGTDVNNKDSDNDGIEDGEELTTGKDGFITNPLLADSDSDGISDLLEVTVGTDPTDIASYDLATSITGINIDPNALVLTFNSVENKDVSAQLTVQGQTLDGQTVDVTRRDRGTNFSSSDLNICNFGGRDGEVFAGQDGSCVITASNSGHEADADIDVRSFDPVALGYVDIYDEALNVDVAGDLAYVATGNGVRVIDISDRTTPVQIANLLIGTAINDIKVRGDYAYLAADGAGLLIVDVKAPAYPQLISRLDFSGDAKDLTLYRGYALIAAADRGLVVADISLAKEPRLITQVNTAAPAQGISGSTDGRLAVLALGNAGIQVFNTELLNAPRSVAHMQASSGQALSGGDVRDVDLENNIAYLADYNLGLVVVDISTPAAPVVTGQTVPINVRRNNDVVKVGGFAILADSFTSGGSGAAIVDARDPNLPTTKRVMTVGGGGTANGIAIDSEYVYIASSTAFAIGQYLDFVDENTVVPTVTLTAPVDNQEMLEGSAVLAKADALDDIGVAKLEFYVNGNIVATDYVAPFEALVPLPTGLPEAEIMVRAYDYAGSVGQSSSVYVTLIADSDVDGISDVDEQTIYGTSPYLADSDNDGLQDLFELNYGFDPLIDDMDEDGLLDGEEFNLGEDGYITAVKVADTDADGMPDGFESQYGFDPTDPSDAVLDFDGDGVSNVDEYLAGTNPISADSDGDGIPDEYERNNGLDPFDASDAYGDLDNDGAPNIVEYLEGTDPRNPDILPPEVTVVAPFNGDLVPVSTILVVRFNEPLKPESVNEDSVRLFDSLGEEYDGTVSLSSDGYILTFDPTLYLPGLTDYTLRVVDVRDLAGNPLAIDYELSISTSDEADVLRPTYLSSVPFDNDTSAPVNSELSILFSELIDPTSVTATNFYLYDNISRKKVEGTIGVTEDGKEIYFVPNQALLVGRSYYLHAQSLRDLSGNTCSNCSSYLRIDFTTDFEPDVTAPQLVATTVVADEVDIARNVKLRFKFSEHLNGRVIEKLRLQTQAGDPVQTVQNLASDHRSVTMTPVALLEENTSYEVFIDEGIEDLGANRTLSSLSYFFTTSAVSDTSTSNISDKNFLSNEKNIPLNFVPKIYFPERIDAVGINSSSIYLHNITENRKVATSLTLSEDRQAISLTPDEPLKAGNYRYRVYVNYCNAGLVDYSGNNLGNCTYADFYTADGTDVSAPAVVSSSVSNGMVDLAINTQFKFNFDEPLSIDCLADATISLSDGVNTYGVDASLTNNRKTLLLAPSENLTASADYNLIVDGLCDYVGLPADTLNLSFSTSDSVVADTQAPTMSIVSPAQNSSDIDPNSAIVVSFDENIDPTTLSGVYVSFNTTSTSSSYRITGSWQYDPELKQATFTADDVLRANSTIYVYPHYLYDLAGNKSTSSYGYFKTGSAQDSTAPTIVMVSPVDGSLDVTDNRIEITFSEGIDRSTINNNNFVYWSDGKLYRPNVSYSIDSRKVILTGGSLPRNTAASLVVTTGVKDHSGNALAEDFASFFATAAVDTDTSRPSIVTQYPIGSSVPLPNADLITLYANDDMDAGSLSDAMNVVANGELVPGSVNVSDDRIIKFVPDEPLAKGDFVQVFVSSEATDTSGNPLNSYQSSFTVESEKVSTRPYMSLYYPANNQVGVPINTQVSIRYTEELDPATVDDVSVTLRKSSRSGEVVPSSVSLNAGGDIVTLIPDENLLSGQRYYAVAQGTIKDTDQDEQYYQRYFYFTTDESGLVDDRAPQVAASSPNNGDNAVPLNAKLSFWFDEVINPVSFADRNEYYSVSVASNNKSMSYYPETVSLPAGESLQLTPPSLADGAGNSLLPYVVNVQTLDQLDQSAPVIVDVTPNNSETGVPVNTHIVVQSNEMLDRYISIADSYLYDTTRNKTVATTRSISADGKQLIYVPDENLDISTNYRTYTKFRNLSGLDRTQYSYFTTSQEEDLLAPVVASSTVIDGEVNIATNVRLRVKFDESIDSVHALNNSVVRLFDSNGELVATNNSVSAHTMMLIPKALLELDAAYKLVIEGVTDRAGNVGAYQEINFVTGSSLDVIASNISDKNFLSNEKNIPLNFVPKIYFPERIDAVGINSSSIYLHNITENRKVATSLTLSEDRQAISLTPDEPLKAGNYRYRVYVNYCNAGLVDYSGNNLGNCTYADFYTADGTDVSAPAVVSSSVSNGMVDLAINTQFKFNFDEPLSIDCLADATISLSDGVNTYGVDASLTNNRKTLLLAPSENLTASADYNLIVDGLCDYVGLPADTLNLSFSTSDSVVADTQAPTMSIVSPAQNSSDIDPNSAIVVSFDENIDPTTLSGVYVSFNTTSTSSSYRITGSWQYDPELKQATFTADDVLRANSTIYVYPHYLYDLAGNKSTTNYGYFRTGNN